MLRLADTVSGPDDRLSLFQEVRWLAELQWRMFPRLIEAALAAVRQYVFKPATAAGEPIAASEVVPVIFRP